MTANEYQEGALNTAKYPDSCKVIYPLLGLAGESGEIFEKLATKMYPKGLPNGWEPVTEKNKLLWHTIHQVASVARNAEVFKKVVRDKTGTLPTGCFDEVGGNLLTITDEEREQLKKELGDVAWYVAVLSNDLGLTLEEVFQHNLDKLQSRKERGVIGGSGDNR